MKRIISMLLACVMLITSANLLFSLSILAAEDQIVASGTCGEALTWNLDSEGTLTISGEGEMTRYYADNTAPWYEYRNRILYAIIEQGVTSIGGCAFYNCTNLTEVSIPDSVTSISAGAFLNCMSLGEITVSSHVTSIGFMAFYGCYALTVVHIDSMALLCGIIVSGSSYLLSYADELYVNNELVTELTIPSGITSIGEGALSGCGAITSVVVPSSVTAIGRFAFDGCENLESVTLPNSLTSIGDYAFRDCISLTEINIPDGVTEIGSQVFYQCESLASITLPSGITDIGYEAFAYCESLVSIDMPSELTSIGKGAFLCCRTLTSIVIPSKVTSIGDFAFDGCEKLYEVYNLSSLEIIKGDTSLGYVGYYALEIYDSLSEPSKITVTSDGCVFYEDEENVYTLYTYVGNEANLVLPDSIDGQSYTIKDRAFEKCDSLVSVTISSGVTAIGHEAFYYCPNLIEVIIANGVKTIGDSAFRDCISLESITIPDSVTSIGEYAFSQCGLKSVELGNSLESIGYGVFEYCRELTSIAIPDSVKVISGYAFYGCQSLSSVTMNNVTNIGNYAFCRCDNLISITIPESVTSIGDYAFNGCIRLFEVYNLSSLEIEEGDNWSHGGLGYYALNIYDDPSVPSKLTTTSDGFVLYEDEDAAYLLKYIGNETSLTLPDLMNGKSYTIYDGAFEDCVGLESVSLPSGITSIRDSVFSGCISLESITIPDSVTSIGNRAFGSCKSLSGVIIPDSVESIGDYAFSNCQSMTSIVIPNSVTSVGTHAFSGCGLTDIVLGNGIKNISDSMFSNCYELIAVTIPDGVTSIGDFAFTNCIRLSDVVIPGSVTSIGADAFSGCALTSITIPNGITQIKYGAFRFNPLTSIVIPDSVTYIGGHAFEYCYALEYIVIPESVKSIAYYAFYGCTELMDVALSDGIENIGDGAFNGCQNLESIIIPNSVTSIGEYAFATDTVIICEAGSYADDYAQTYGYAVEHGAAKITLFVKNENGETITDGYQIRWYEKGSDELLAEGRTLNGTEKGKTYEYLVVLDETTGVLYTAPERQEIFVAQDSENSLTITYTLKSIPEITVTGKLVDSDGNALAGVAVVSTQTVNGKYIQTVQTQTNENGVYSVTLAKLGVSMVFSLSGYYNKTVSLTGLSTQTANTYDAGTVTMNAVPANKITLTLNRQPSVETVASAHYQSITSFYGLQFSLYDMTQDRPICDFTLQYPYVIINDEGVSGGDVISIAATDTQSRMTAAPIEIKLSELKVGNGELVFLENGKIKLTDITGSGKAMVMLFDEDGNFIYSASADGSFTSDALPAGNYALIFMKKTSLLRSVPNIGKLDEMGLEENTDYTLRNVTVSNGVITVIDGITVPDFDESRLYYTVDESTFFTATNSSSSLGKYVQMRLEYKIDSKYQSSGQYVTIEIPEGLVFTENSLTLNGSQVPYTKNGNEIKVMTNRTDGVIRFYVHAEASGSHNVSAYLGFDIDGNDIVQPIGTASFTAEADKLDVPTKVGRTEITASGITLPNSTVTVYDNGTAVGTVTSNKNGSWSLTFELVKPYNYSSHEIYTTIANERFTEDVQTDISTLLYDESYIDLSKITMIHSGSEAVFDFINSDASDSSYTYVPGETSFTFKVEFTGGDDTTTQDVYVVATNAAGEDTYIQTVYDPNTGLWLGACEFHSFEEIPVAINAVWENTTVDTQPVHINDEHFEDLTESLANNWSTLTDNIDTLLEYGEATETENGFTMDILYEGEKFAEFDVECIDYDFNAEKWMSSGYMESIDEDGNTVYFFTETSELSHISYYAYPDTQVMLKVEMRFVDNQVSKGLRLARNSDGTLADWAKLIGDLIPGGVADATRLFFETAFDMQNFYITIKSDGEILRSILDTAIAIVNSKCSDGSYKIKDPMVLKQYRNLIMEYQWETYDFETQALDAVKIYLTISAACKVIGGKICEEIASNATITNSTSKKAYETFQNVLAKKKIYLQYNAHEFYSGVNANVMQSGYSLLLDKVSPDNILKFIFDFEGFIDDQYQELNKKYRDLLVEIMSHYSECGDDPEDNTNDPIPPEREPDNPSIKITPSLDPSGYVYEAVPSNRVEGVKVEAYYLGDVLDEFGEPTGETEDILWDASEYDQVNPLYTDKNGRYAWDVPVGQWLVKYSKEGYYDTDSRGDRAAVDGYLPVPPPQVDVNVGIVSKAAPTVANVNVYTGEIQIIFSQYMQLDTINTTNVVFRQNGNVISGTIAPANAEYNYEGTVQYASIFTFTPSVSLEGLVEVEIDHVVNYAGRAITAAYSTQKSIAVKPESISLPENISMDYGDSMTVPVQVLPAQAGETVTLKITSSSESIVSVETVTVTTDEHGMANIVLNGLLPGQCDITVEMDGTNVSASSRVKVVMKQRSSANQCEKVVANIASGTEVEAGTQIILSTPTDGADIYYTLDKTCPCVEDNPSRIKYTGPLTVTEDMFIIAYAVKDGYEESATSQFSYTVKGSSVCDHAQSTSKPDCEHPAACSVCGGQMGALGHDYASELTAGEDSHGYECSRCGSRKDEEPHTFVWIIDREPTEKEDGTKHETCACGKTRNEGTAIPKTSDTLSTGVILAIAAAGVALLTCVGFVCYFVVTKKKRSAH